MEKYKLSREDLREWYIVLGKIVYHESKRLQKESGRKAKEEAQSIGGFLTRFVFRYCLEDLGLSPVEYDWCFAEFEKDREGMATWGMYDDDDKVIYLNYQANLGTSLAFLGARSLDKLESSGELPSVEHCLKVVEESFMVIGHELRHAYQHKHGVNTQYTSSQVSIEEYENCPAEVDARQYEHRFLKAEMLEVITRIITECEVN